MRSTNRIESIQKRALRLLYNYYTTTQDGLLAKANKSSMEILHYRTLALEIFQTLDVLNRTYMPDLFYFCSSSARRPNNIAAIKKQIQTRMKRKALDHCDVRPGILYQNT